MFGLALNVYVAPTVVRGRPAQRRGGGRRLRRPDCAPCVGLPARAGPRRDGRRLRRAVPVLPADVHRAGPGGAGLPLPDHQRGDAQLGAVGPRDDAHCPRRRLQGRRRDRRLRARRQRPGGELHAYGAPALLLPPRRPRRARRRRLRRLRLSPPLLRAVRHTRDGARRGYPRLPHAQGGARRLLHAPGLARHLRLPRRRPGGLPRREAPRRRALLLCAALAVRRRRRGRVRLRGRLRAERPPLHLLRPPAARLHRPLPGPRRQRLAGGDRPARRRPRRRGRPAAGRHAAHHHLRPRPRRRRGRRRLSEAGGAALADDPSGDVPPFFRLDDDLGALVNRRAAPLAPPRTTPTSRRRTRGRSTSPPSRSSA